MVTSGEFHFRWLKMKQYSEDMNNQTPISIALFFTILDGPSKIKFVIGLEIFEP